MCQVICEMKKQGLGRVRGKSKRKKHAQKNNSQSSIGKHNAKNKQSHSHGVERHHRRDIGIHWHGIEYWKAVEQGRLLEFEETEQAIPLAKHVAIHGIVLARTSREKTNISATKNKVQHDSSSTYVDDAATTGKSPQRDDEGPLDDGKNNKTNAL